MGEIASTRVGNREPSLRSSVVEERVLLGEDRLAGVDVAHGRLGLDGALGYESQRVAVGGRGIAHALSAHGPSRLRFRLDPGFRSFSCRVALNDDVTDRRAYGHFAVIADGERVACAPYVRAGTAPPELRADVTGARDLELVVTTSQWEFCHSVWLDPALSTLSVGGPDATLIDPLGRAEIVLPRPVPKARRCIATVASPGFEGLLFNMLGSLRTHGRCEDALLVVFAVDPTPEFLRAIAERGALPVICKRLTPISVALKSILYSVARVVDAETYVCLDADMLVLGDLSGIDGALDVAPRGSILACWEANTRRFPHVDSALRHVYFGHPADLVGILGRVEHEASYPFVVNDGLFAGQAVGLLALDGAIRAMPGAIRWMSEKPGQCWWRNQFIFNLALAALRCGVALDDVFNVQLHTNDPEAWVEEGRVRASWKGRDVRVLHFCGSGRSKVPESRGVYDR